MRKKLRVRLPRPATASRVNFEVTTIAIARDTKELLDAFKKPNESNDAALQRFLHGQVDIWVDVLSVDNDTPDKHTVLFQLGDYYHQWKFGRIEPVRREELKVVLSK